LILYASGTPTTESGSDERQQPNKKSATSSRLCRILNKKKTILKGPSSGTKKIDLFSGQPTGFEQ
jgi:hypothetical protein